MSTLHDVASAMVEMGLVPAKITSDEVFALCPNHDDTKPNSWSVNRETGNHYCFSCGYKGSFQGLVMDVLGLDLWAAARWVRTHGVDLLDPADLPNYEQAVAQRGHVSRKVGEPLNDSALALYYRPPWEQVEERSLSMEACDFFDVLWDHEKQGWIIPIRRPDGALLGWQFKSKRMFLNYPEGAPKSLCLFGWDAIQETAHTAVLVESPLDCARMHAAGVDPAEYALLSSYGAEVSDDQMRLIVRRFPNVILALDNDKAGQKALSRLLFGTVEQRGKTTIKVDGWMSRINCLAYNYAGSDVKDPGDQGDDEILTSLATALPGIKTGLTRVKVGDSVHRDSQAVPGSRRRQDRRQASGTGKRGTMGMKWKT